MTTIKVKPHSSMRVVWKKEEEEVTTAESCNVATNEEENPRDLAHFENLKELSMWVNKLMEKRENLENINITFSVTTKHTEY